LGRWCLWPACIARPDIIKRPHHTKPLPPGTPSDPPCPAVPAPPRAGGQECSGGGRGLRGVPTGPHLPCPGAPPPPPRQRPWGHPANPGLTSPAPSPWSRVSAGWPPGQVLAGPGSVPPSVCRPRPSGADSAPGLVRPAFRAPRRGPSSTSSPSSPASSGASPGSPTASLPPASVQPPFPMGPTNRQMVGVGAFAVPCKHARRNAMPPECVGGCGIRPAMRLLQIQPNHLPYFKFKRMKNVILCPGHFFSKTFAAPAVFLVLLTYNGREYIDYYSMKPHDAGLVDAVFLRMKKVIVVRTSHISLLLSLLSFTF